MGYLGIKKLLVEIGQEYAGREGMLQSTEILSDLVCCLHLFQTFCH